MGINIKKQLNKAEKTVLCAAIAAMILTSAYPRVSFAAGVKIPVNKPAEAIQTPKQTPKVVVKKSVTVTATAYSSTPDQTDATPLITSNGKQVYDGLVAANWLPYGTKVRIPDMFGDKIFTVNDRMNKRYSNRLDVWMQTRNAAKQFGIRNIRVEVIE